MCYKVLCLITILVEIAALYIDANYVIEKEGKLVDNAGRQNRQRRQCGQKRYHQDRGKMS
jgi:hypothetical protein